MKTTVNICRNFTMESHTDFSSMSRKEMVAYLEHRTNNHKFGHVIDFHDFDNDEMIKFCKLFETDIEFDTKTKNYTDN